MWRSTEGRRREEKGGEGGDERRKGDDCSFGGSAEENREGNFGKFFLWLQQPLACLHPPSLLSETKILFRPTATLGLPSSLSGVTSLASHLLGPPPPSQNSMRTI
jgi:hypothetical protein